MSFTQVDEIRKIEDYAACREATRAYICDSANPLLDILYAAARLNETGQYAVYKGMKQYYDADSRDIADTAWEYSQRFGNFAEELFEQEAALRLLDDGALLKRFGSSLYNVFLIGEVADVVEGLLALETRNFIAEQLTTFTERQEELRNEVRKREKNPNY